MIVDAFQFHLVKKMGIVLFSLSPGAPQGRWNYTGAGQEWGSSFWQ
jgi:hypothetical protein